MSVGEWFNRFIDLFFPCCCVGCARPMVEGERYVCAACLFHLPETNYHLDDRNEAALSLGGQFPLGFIVCFLLFEDRSVVQQIIHHFKYLGMHGLGRNFGVKYGKILRDSAHQVCEADFLIPVPMQPNKLRRRGYNQSLIFAQGLAEELLLPVLPTGLIKIKNTTTQVGMARKKRFENLAGVFKTNVEEESLVGKHVVLVDDVLTSGATIIRCSEALVAAGVARISVVTLARKRN